MPESEDEVIRRAMAAIGRRTSEKKAATSAANGRKGGRPAGAVEPELLRPLSAFECNCATGPNGADEDHKSYCPRGRAFRRRMKDSG